MLSKQPIGDMWSLPDNDPHSQHYGESLDFDFSYIHSEEMKSVVKDYIWHCWRVNNGALASRQWLNRSLQYFMVFAKANNIYSFKELTNAVVDLFLSYLRTVISPATKRPLSYKSQKGCLDAVKSVVAWCRVHRPEAVPVTEIFTGNEFPGVNRSVKIEFIPDAVMEQINNALKTEEDPYIKYGIIILASTGMRQGDLRKLRVDCIQPHIISGYTITWYDHKNRRQRPPMPVRSECAYAVQKLIELTEPLRKDADPKNKDFLYIYRCPYTAKAGQVIVPHKETINLWLRRFVKRHNITDASGELFNLTTHMFRRTLGTDMISKGVDLSVIQQVLGHSNPVTTKLFYADVKDRERAEVFREIGIIGNIDMIDDSVFESPAEKEWFQVHKYKGAALCDGYCTKPFAPGAVCDRLLKRQKCYSCSRYITTPEYLDTHRSHLERLERQLVEGAIYGEHYAEHFRPTIEVLKDIINRLESLQNERK